MPAPHQHPRPPVLAVVALGANIGDRLATLRGALAGLEALACGPIRASRVFETAPMYVEEQPAFYNAVVAFPTTLGPEALLRGLLGIEETCGRVRTMRNGPRVIDLDLLDLGGARLRTDGLLLPHPRLSERAFVLVPLLDVVPGWQHPETGVAATQLLRALPPGPPPTPVAPLEPEAPALPEVRR